MSRIDEALKRASQGPSTSRSSYRGAEVPLRLAEETTLNEYPLERSNLPVVDRADAPAEHAAVAPRRSAICKRGSHSTRTRPLDATTDSDAPLRETSH